MGGCSPCSLDHTADDCPSDPHRARYAGSDCRGSRHLLTHGSGGREALRARGCTAVPWKQGHSSPLARGGRHMSGPRLTGMRVCHCLQGLGSRQGEMTMSTDRVSKMWYLQTVGHYPICKRKEILTHGPTRMNPRDTLPSEISRSRKTNKQILYDSTRIVEFVETDNGEVTAGGRGRQKGESVFKGDRVSVWGDENVLELEGRMAMTA